ncbi:hypothetical protein HHI36_000099 [Cryptolaemus montrouzieri]|uniref:Chemosensory protein n=1 Tax=Cryptolaemus montrouzieri TaxID=559131 RepID=A0ABD2P3T6_9CUCU
MKLNILPLVSVLLFFFNFIECQLGGGNSYVEKQLLCALDRGPCDGLGKQVKDSLPEIIGNHCQNCNPRQYANARRIASFVRSKYPLVWNELVDKYGNQQQ